MGQLVFQATLGGAVNLIGPNIAGTVNFTLPSADGSSGQTWTTNGSGVLSFGTLGVAGGGTGLTTTPANGALDIGNGTGFTRTTLTAGSNITITNSSGGITIAASSGASAATPTALGTVYGNTPSSATVVALGYQAGNGNTSGLYNTFVGYTAGYSNTTNGYCTFVGYQAGYAYTGGEATAFGFQALATSTSGNSTAIGQNAAYSTTTGSVVAVGKNTLRNNTTGADNVAVGGSGTGAGAAMQSNTTGANNTAIGNGALYANTTANNNTAVGYQALSANTTATANAAVGHQALAGVTTGVSNTSLGYQAGNWSTALTTGVQGTYIGAYTRPSSSSAQAEVVLGYDIAGKGSLTAYIRGDNGSYNSANSATWAVTSDQRLKKNIIDNNDGLDKINSIRVRNFEYRLSEEITELDASDAIKKTGIQLGVIAQELQAVLPECVKEQSTGVLSVDTDNLTWYLINAVKQLKTEIDQLKGNV